MIIKLSELADITLGTILTRVNAESHDDAISVDTISMQEVSYYAGKTDIKGETLYSKIKANKVTSCVFTKENDIVLGLTSRSAMVIDCSRANKLIASNFLKIRIHDTNLLNPKYLCWLINENSTIINYIESNKQGTAAVSVLKAQDIRELPIEIIPLENQLKIANFYDSYLKKYRIDRKLAELYFIANKFIANQYFKGEIKNENK